MIIYCWRCTYYGQIIHKLRIPSILSFMTSSWLKDCINTPQISRIISSESVWSSLYLSEIEAKAEHLSFWWLQPSLPLFFLTSFYLERKFSLLAISTSHIVHKESGKEKLMRKIRFHFLLTPSAFQEAGRPSMMPAADFKASHFSCVNTSACISF